MIVIGNMISFIAALFMIASCIVKDRKQVFYLQFLQCALLAVSSWYFSSYSGIVANLVAAFRNLTVAQKNLRRKWQCYFWYYRLY